MPSFGIKKKDKKKEVTSTGFTEEQIKAQKSGSKVRAIGAVSARRKQMEEILGN